ncbi:MAG: protein NosL [Pseudomonadota bacterium]
MNLLLLAACSNDPGTGPLAIHWDRQACDHCRMVLSDHQHAAQIRQRQAEGRLSQVFFFDDLGCALVWLEAQPQPVREDPANEIWVAGWRDGFWLDARAAHYLPGQVTPMAYGLGAQSMPQAGTLTFAAAKARILTHEYSRHP